MGLDDLFAEAVQFAEQSDFTQSKTPDDVRCVPPAAPATHS